MNYHPQWFLEDVRGEDRMGYNRYESSGGLGGSTRKVIAKIALAGGAPSREELKGFSAARSKRQGKLWWWCAEQRG